jgi:hypothetical protein
MSASAPIATVNRTARGHLSLDNRRRGSKILNATFLTRRFQWFHRVKRPRRLVRHSFGPQHSGKSARTVRRARRSRVASVGHDPNLAAPGEQHFHQRLHGRVEGLPAICEPMP